MPGTDHSAYFRNWTPKNCDFASGFPFKPPNKGTLKKDTPNMTELRSEKKGSMGRWKNLELFFLEACTPTVRLHPC